MTFYLGHVLFYRSMETFLVNFLKAYSQDHLGKRLLLNHNANQWYTNTRPNVLYQWYLLRCQTENTNQGFVHNLYNHAQRARTQRRREVGETGGDVTMLHGSRPSILLPPLDMSCKLCASLVTACQQIKHIFVSLNCIYTANVTRTRVVFPKHLELNMNIC